MASNSDPAELLVRFEELSVLEADFEEAELEIIRKAEALQAPLYQKRAEFITKVPYFWSLVFEQAPPEVETFILPSDSKLFADCLDTFQVTRFELDDPKGSPRSFSLRFGFKENEYFEDSVLEKKFWFRRTRDWAGLVSEAVKIRWKEGKDLTSGLTDAAHKLGEERKKLAIDTSNPDLRKQETRTKAYKELSKLIETSESESVSFFGLFAFVSGYRWVSGEESEQVVTQNRERVEKIKSGEQVDEEEDEEDDMQDYQEVEVFPRGDEVATVIADDLWQNAIKYYKATFDEEEHDDDDEEDLSGMDVDSDEEDEEEDEKVDIRALVGKGRKAAKSSPPAKKQRKV